ncbi:GNAT family N-acetyltransferase [Brevibacillus centrosporus]|uniref:Protein N-acetyltransferase, RimJ/RimL family n=1 Tax=Brevibacillus centrosporus TaxID=54910 RepID=A0A1I3Z5E5_9BACL|nr:GNAT family N-acetyltransferase [Brevibacillus centrosporus]MEC2127607.1 GNAT family N-acetyltransferase [Brevibacillus centrosporus]MED4910103.1 GNAT family N-acetyltransferase [Brevibacillus centrosporus]RNB67001.1 GNAT family N-acetyltransferase [Brevibacillus centrosporus]SFK39325.1 Protein N-acetyltransferase, RimJ/RimL family [Brevibacillus centrosporus]GED34956.1 acetyltransferase [Brevibacillus centrosporus]
MIIDKQEYHVKGTTYTIRSAAPSDAEALSGLRVKIDGETENLDREPGEAFIDPAGFEQIIQMDAQLTRNLFLVAVVEDKIVGFSRCEGTYLTRFAHKAEFGVCILKAYWGFGIGKNLLKQSLAWADSNGIKKMTLNVLQTNEKAIQLYEKLGFEVEGVWKHDRLLSDENYYHTVVMGRFVEEQRAGDSDQRKTVLAGGDKKT